MRYAFLACLLAISPGLHAQAFRQARAIAARLFVENGIRLD